MQNIWQLASISNDYDGVLFGILLSVFGLFMLEIFVQSFVQPSCVVATRARTRTHARTPTPAHALALCHGRHSRTRARCTLQVHVFVLLLDGFHRHVVDFA